MNVTFLPEAESSFALLLPNDSALLPPVCIWRMKKIQSPTSSRTGAQPISMVSSVDSLGSSNVMRTLAASSFSTRPSVTRAWDRNSVFSGKRPEGLSVPLISEPRMVTSSTFWLRISSSSSL